MGATRAPNPSAAYLENASRFVFGYYTPGGYEVTVEDAAHHKLTEPRRFSGSTVSAMTAAAKWIDPAARAFSTAREDAVEAWGRGDFERAVELDPDFGTAWLARVESLIQHGDAARGMEAADRALARPALRSDIDRARLEVLSANLHNDPRRRAEALAKLAGLTGDPATTLALAEAQVNARNFPAAIAAFQKTLTGNPNNAGVLLSLGYAQAYAGDLAAAKQTLETYGKQPGQKTNSLDSLGEACFMNGQFADAQKYFLAAYESDPKSAGAPDLLKAAYAQWLAGDVKGADSTAARYFQPQPDADWRAAVWLFSTSRRDQAVAKLQSIANAQLRARQLAAWNAPLPEDLDALKSRYEHTPTARDDEIRVLYAAALVKAGRKDEARGLLRRWPLPVQASGDPLTQSRMLPAFMEARKSTE